MIRLIFILPAVFILSCRGGVKGDETESFGENKSAGVVASCLCSDLTKDSTGKLLLSDKLYTGTCIVNYEGSDSKYIEKQILGGVLNGLIRYYGRTGDVIFEEKFESGNYQIDLNLENVRCKCSELKKDLNNSLYYYKGQIFKGVCIDNFPNTDQPYIEISYIKGLRNGYTIYFSKSGDTLYREDYQSGELSKIIYN